MSFPLRAADVSLIRETKLFFFFAYDKYHSRLNDTPGQVTIPTTRSYKATFHNWPMPTMIPSSSIQQIKVAPAESVHELRLFGTAKTT